MQMTHKFTWNLTLNFDSSIIELTNCLEVIQAWVMIKLEACYCILFKYNLLTYKAIHFSQPPYLSSLIRQSDLTRGNGLSIFSSKPNKCSGLRSFIVAAPIEWNKLPQAIRTMGSISGFRK